MIGNHKVGIMQGRLTPPMGRGIQFFPFNNWKNEFYIAREIGLDQIEFIFDYEQYHMNPLWNEDELNELAKTVKETGVQIGAVCFDYFMRRPFFKAASNQRKDILEENKQILKQVLKAMRRLGVNLIEIPLVDDSSLKTKEEEELFREFLLSIVKEAGADMQFGLETDLPPVEFRKYLDSFHSKQIGANYDSGNSSGLGYDPYEEVTILGDYIFNIHIKDRKYQGTTVALGTGSADFDRLFSGLREICYKDAFILQAARGEEGKEKENIVKQIRFLKRYCG